METHVAEELNIDGDAAHRLVNGCKAVEQTINAPEIVELARMKLHSAQDQIKKGKIPNVTGLLIKHVPTMCTGVDLRKARAEIQKRAESRASRVAYIRETWHDYDAEEQQRALQEFPELANPQGAGGND